MSSTREEVVLVFGINPAWERGQAEGRVQFRDQLLLNLISAKRLAPLLYGVMRE